jgi:hypothetical protein
MAQCLSDLITAHPPAEQQQPMQAMIVPGLGGSGDLLLQSDFRRLCILKLKSSHGHLLSRPPWYHKEYVCATIYDAMYNEGIPKRQFGFPTFQGVPHQLPRVWEIGRFRYSLYRFALAKLSLTE